MIQEYYGSRNCNVAARGIGVPYIFIYKKTSIFLVAAPNSLNGTAGVSSTSEPISQTAEAMIQQSALQELEKWKPKFAMNQ